MAKSVLNKSKTVDFTKQPMFFGEDLQIQRYDTMKYPIFDKLTQQQLGYFWRPEEVSLQKDRNDYLDLREEQKFIFTSNLKYQTMLDSVQGRGPCLAFLPFVSLPELEGAIVDKSKVDMYELKKKLYLAMVSVNILEGLRFYVSFACSFAFGELKKLEGSAKIISFIARDESQHLAMSQRVINNWKDYENDKDFLKIIKETEKEVYNMYDEAVQEEKRWATYLFSKGSMIGLSEKLLHQFVEFTANRRMKGIQLTPAYDQKTNPLPWTDHWLNSRSTQNAPQETEIESYVIGGIKQDVKKDQFKSFKL